MQHQSATNVNKINPIGWHRGFDPAFGLTRKRAAYLIRAARSRRVNVKVKRGFSSTTYYFADCDFTIAVA